MTPTVTRSLLLCCLLSCTIDGLLAAGNDRAGFVYRRQQMREATAATRANYLAAKEETAHDYLTAMAKAVTLCLDQGQRQRAETLIAGMAADRPDWEPLAALRERLAATREAEVDDKTSRAIDKAIDKAVDRRSRSLIRFTNKLLEYRLYGLAYDNVMEILRHDPDNKAVRKTLGQVYDTERQLWQHHFYASRWKKEGLKWDDRYGWFRYQEAERYAAGEHYDLQLGRWGRLDELDPLHRSIETPWLIESQHFILHAGCDRATALAAIRELEDLYKAWIRNFVAYFGPHEAGARLFDAEELPKLVVYLWADKEMYSQWVHRHFQGDPLLLDSVGFYSSSNQASQFFLGRGWRSTMWHEVTHQIFGETSQGHAKQVSLTEGLAVYMQNGQLDDGRIIIDLGANRHIRAFRDDFASGRFSDFFTTWNRSRASFHNDERSKHYAEAGLATFFLMQADDGRFGSDLIDFARDSYNGKPAFDIDAYCGLEADELQQRYRAWVGQVMTGDQH